MHKILVSEITDTDTRPAGWWWSADEQGMMDMTGATLAEAKATLLKECAADEVGREEILTGTLQVLSLDLDDEAGPTAPRR